MTPQECCVLIPSLSPDERLPEYVQALRAAGYGLVLVVDDGSAESYQEIFARIAAWPGCHVLHHGVNRGKGAALKTGFAYIQEQTGLRGIITADSDGQHTVPDTLKLTAALGDKQELLLGTRDFFSKSSGIPFKSRAGNRITACVFKLLYGPWLPDTQTGLRAFPRALISFMNGVKGERFEYEMNQLIHCAGWHIPMRPIPIETVYHDDNKGSHFHPFRDSWRIYKLIFGNFFRFMSASCAATIVDLALFAVVFRWVFPGATGVTAASIGGEVLLKLPANAIARICSAVVNYRLNKSFVFQLKECKGAAGRYALLCVCVLLCSNLAQGLLGAVLPAWFNPTILKALVDTVLYFVNYRIQRAWVFPQANEG